VNLSLPVLRSRAAVISENLFLRRQLALYLERKTWPTPPKPHHEIRLGGPEPILPLGESSGIREAEYLDPLAPSGIPSLLALEVAPYRASAPTQEPPCTHRDDGPRESELGRGTDRG